MSRAPIWASAPNTAGPNTRSCCCALSRSRRKQFARWVQQQRQAAAAEPADSVAAAGRRVFLGTICASCHAVVGTDADGRYGPDLTHLMSRATIGAGAAPNTRESLLAWVRNPDDLKHGVLMPAMQIDEEYLHQLVEYLITLR